MATRVGTIERAYQLASSGGFRTAREITVQLGREGYLDATSQIAGATLRRELGRICRGSLRQMAIDPEDDSGE